MKIEGVTGPQTLADGTIMSPRLGKTGELVVELYGRYYEPTYRGLMYNAANQAAQAISVALNTTYTGLGLYNPVGSGVNLILNKMNFAPSIAEVALSALGLISAYAATGAVTTQTTAIVTSGNIIGGAPGKGIALSAATIVTPKWLASTVGTVATSGFQAAIPIDLEGSVIIPPGGFVGWGALTAVTGFGFMFWAEAPI